jgi:putative sterol carrier protein
VSDADEVEAFFKALPSRFRPEAAAGLHATFAMDIDGAGSWHATVDDGALTLERGTHPSPDVRVSSSAKIWCRLVAGELDPQFAFMTRRLKVAGDMGLAMRFRSLFL